MHAGQLFGGYQLASSAFVFVQRNVNKNDVPALQRPHQLLGVGEVAQAQTIGHFSEVEVHPLTGEIFVLVKINLE